MPRIEVAAALQGLAGLRVEEALNLTWDKVDLDRGLVEISGKVKNASSVRVIPVCRFVLDVLKRADKLRGQNPKVQSLREPVTVNEAGGPYRDYRHYTKVFAKALKTWKHAGLGWTPKDLRNCIQDFAVSSGLFSHLWDQYVGHTPRGSVAPLTAVSRGQWESLEENMRLLRRHVVGAHRQGG